MDPVLEKEVLEFLEKTSKDMVKDLFGKNVLPITRFHFFSISLTETDESEFYISNNLHHFDFWYNTSSFLRDSVRILSNGIALLDNKMVKSGRLFTNSKYLYEKYSKGI